jgi:signal transduction histidine kinase
MARYGPRDLIQGVVIDWPQLQDEFQKIVADLFPEARFEPISVGSDSNDERVMSSLPLVLDPGPMVDVPALGVTPLRIGLGVAWAAILAALVAIGITGWSLIDLSERRVRFVSAVTHELRTPLTTLRLYLDMLTSGMVKDDAKKQEYLFTLNDESERLHRLISNVLDFARLEKQSARPALGALHVDQVLEQARATWSDRCHANGKVLTVENHLPGGATIQSDSVLVQQILSNLIDNACKYSKEANDQRVWLRARIVGDNRIALDVEDCGPGVGRRECRTIFRPFRRGDRAETTAGGVGLGLALAKRWAAMLGGRLELQRGEHGAGACFRLELPMA